MSMISTPRSSRGPSPANDGSPGVLTPRRKIQALLAGIGSDSESEQDTNAYRKVAPTLNTNASRHDTADGEKSDDAEEDDLPQAPKGRLAARMQTQCGENEQPASEKETAFERVKKSLNAGKEEQNTKVASDGLSSSEDDVPVSKGSRRLVKHTQNEPEPTEGGSGSDQVRSESPLFCSPHKPEEKRPDATPNTHGSDRARSESPLFCSPYKPQEERPAATPITRGSDYEEEVQQPKNARFLALIEKKRKEREAKEKEETEKQRRRAEIAKTINSEEISDGSDDDLAGRKLTQNSKPTRKASKKALEAMNQETQRISRNMQLAHQAKTKKKITKESFFSRFNFGKKSEGNTAAPHNSSTTGSSQPPSGGEEHATPPTSPLRSPRKDTTKTASTENQVPGLQPVAEDADVSDTENMVSLEELLENPTAPPQPEQKQEKPQEHATTPDATSAAAPTAAPKALSKAPVRVRVSRASVAEKQKDDSDSDLEVVTSPGKCRRIAAFENLPVKKSQVSDSMVRLRALAHLSSPSKRLGSSMTASEMQASLRKQARQQAMQEKQEKIQDLKDKGIYVDTAEERAKVEEDVEDLMEKARMEGEEISKKEKQAAKKEGKDEPNAFDDEDDEDYVGDEEEVDLSGSDDGEEDEDGLAENETGNAKSQGENVGLVDDEVGVAEESEEDPIEDDDIEIASEHQNATEPSTRRRERRRRVISDDEDEGPEAASEQTSNQQSQSAKKPQFPGLQTTEEPSLGLTQAFAATFGDSQQDTQQDSLAALRSMPDPGLIGSELLEPDSQEIVKDSQERPSEPIDLFAGYTQSDARVPASPGGAQVFTQNSEIPDPTQDAGFVLSPFDQRNRFRDARSSTQETVLLQNGDSPDVRKKGKLLRRGPAPPDAPEGDNGFTIKASAFDVLRKKAKKAPELFDKTKSNAKEIVDEAAEESEDEYAGLGGASDDGADEEDEYDASMINDNSGEKVDEKELAALNANHVREQDEKQVSKLMKDITTGALRRKRGAADDLDLSDSDDERLASRRRAKRREFNKMRKALLEDEKIGQIAENPKKLAFLRAIEDREPDDYIDNDFLQEPGSQEEASKEESASQDAQAGNAEANEKNTKRPLKPSAADTTNRPPPSHRRTIASKKPATLAEIRESVSFLLEGPNAGESKRKVLSDSEEDSGDENNDANADGENGSKRRKKNYYPRPHNREELENRTAVNPAAASNGQHSKGGASRMAFHTKSAEDPDADLTPQIPAYFRPGAMTMAARIMQSNAPNTSSVNSGNLDLKTVRNSTGGEKKKGAVNYYTAAREQQRARDIKLREKKERTTNVKSLLQAKGKGGLGALVRQGQWE